MSNYSKTIKTNKNLILVKEAEASKKIEYIKNHSLSKKEKKEIEIEIVKIKNEIKSLNKEIENIKSSIYKNIDDLEYKLSLCQQEIENIDIEKSIIASETKKMLSKINNRNRFGIDTDSISFSIDNDAIYDYNSYSAVASFNRSFPTNVREAICEYYAI